MVDGKQGHVATMNLYKDNNKKALALDRPDLATRPAFVSGTSPSTPPPSFEGGGWLGLKKRQGRCDRADQGECHPNGVGGIRLAAALPCSQSDWGRASSSRVTLRSPLGRRCGDRLATPGRIAIFLMQTSHESPSQEGEGVHGGAAKAKEGSLRRGPRKW